jgi:hypothetical protein
MSSESRYNIKAFQGVLVDCIDTVRKFVDDGLRSLYEEAALLKRDEHHSSLAHVSNVLYQGFGLAGNPIDFDWPPAFSAPFVTTLAVTVQVCACQVACSAIFVRVSCVPDTVVILLAPLPLSLPAAG